MGLRSVRLMAAYENIDLQVRDGVAHLTLNRPDAANGINRELAQDLMDATLAIAADPGARVVLLTGAGRAFCVGADLKAHGEGARTEGDRERYVGLGQQVCAQIQRMGTPVIAAVMDFRFMGGSLGAAVGELITVAAEASRGGDRLLRKVIARAS